MDDKTTLEDLLQLELHKFEEEVKNIVDKAVKEMAMEKVLTEVTNTWSVLEFEKFLHERTKLYVLRIGEEVIDTLEDHQVIYLNFIHFIYIYFFILSHILFRYNCKICWVLNLLDSSPFKFKTGKIN